VVAREGTVMSLEVAVLVTKLLLAMAVGAIVVVLSKGGSK
jgi:hypothetical protein